MTQLALSYAKAQAKQGMRQALDHAERVQPNWGEAAYCALTEFARGREQFTALEFRQFARERGLSEPPTPKAFGGIFRRAARLGVIRKAGYAPHAERHASPTVVWRRAA